MSQNIDTVHLLLLYFSFPQQGEIDLCQWLACMVAVDAGMSVGINKDFHKIHLYSSYVHTA